MVIPFDIYIMASENINIDKYVGNLLGFREIHTKGISLNASIVFKKCAS